MTTAISREVLVMMSFGGTVSDNVKHWSLRFHKLKHIIENEMAVRVNKVPVKYKVRFLYSNVGEFNDLLEDVVCSHIVILFVSGYNNNVIYEMAVRSALRGWMLLIVDNPDDLPAYCRDELFLNWADITDDAAEQELKSFPIEIPNINFDPTDEKPQIKQIFAQDTTLADSLEKSFKNVELGRSRKSNLQTLTKYIMPGEILDNWSPPLPISVVRITWAGMADGRYEKENLIFGPIVHSANDRFLKMFGLTQLPNPFDDSPLTTEKLVNYLQKDGVAANLNEFLADQEAVMTPVFFYGSEVTANVPLRFNEKCIAYPNKAFLPILIGTNTIGSTEVTHDKFYAILYSPAIDGNVGAASI